MESSNTVMGVLKAFGTKSDNIRLIKIGCVNGRMPKIPIGHIVEGTLNSRIEVGLSFNISNATESDGSKWDLWCTSIIQKILSENTFETKNSIYKWEKI